MDTWENLQARLYHLGWLGEELPAFVATPGGAWLFRQIGREALAVAAVVAEYLAECDRAGLTNPNPTTTSAPLRHTPGQDRTSPDDLSEDTDTAGTVPGATGAASDSRPDGNGGGAA